MRRPPIFILRPDLRSKPSTLPQRWTSLYRIRLRERAPIKPHIFLLSLPPSSSRAFLLRFNPTTMAKFKAFYEQVPIPDLRVPGRLKAASYVFKDKALEQQVFTLRGPGYAASTAYNNESLEWLGDGLLKGFHSTMLYDMCPGFNESCLSVSISYQIQCGGFLIECRICDMPLRTTSSTPR